MYFVYLSFSSDAKEVDILRVFTLWLFFCVENEGKQFNTVQNHNPYHTKTESHR